MSRFTRLHSSSFLFLFLLMAGPPATHAATYAASVSAPQAASTSTEVLVVGSEFAQVYERNADGEFTGLGVDILRAMARQSGTTLKFAIYPWARAQWMVENNQAQILVGPYKTAEREAKFSFARLAFYRDLLVFYARKDNSLRWDGNFSSLPGKKIAVVNGWAYGAQFEDMRAALKPQVVNSLTNGLHMLNAGRMDFLASNIRNTEALVKTLGLEQDFIVAGPVIDNQDGYLAYCRQPLCDQLRMHFDELYARLLDSGELAKIARGYAVKMP